MIWNLPWASDKRMSECVLYHVGGVFYKTDNEDKRIPVHKHCLQELREREEKKDDSKKEEPINES